MYSTLRNVPKSQKCIEVTFTTLSIKTVEKVREKNKLISDKQKTDRPTFIRRLVSARLAGRPKKTCADRWTDGHTVEPCYNGNGYKGEQSKYLVQMESKP